MSKCLMGGIEDCSADFDGPCAPHFGVVLKLAANPELVLTRTLQTPYMPKNLNLLDSTTFEEHRVQNKKKPENNIEQQKNASIEK